MIVEVIHIKNALYNIFILKPVATIIIFVLTVIGLLWLFNDTYIYEYKDVTCEITYPDENLRFDLLLSEGEEKYLEENDSVILFWNVDERVFQAVVVNIDERNFPVKLELEFTEKDFKLLKPEYFNNEATIRINTNKVGIWQKILR